MGDTYNAITELLDKMRYSGNRLQVYFGHQLPPDLVTIATDTLKLYLRIFAISIKMMRNNFSE